MRIITIKEFMKITKDVPQKYALECSDLRRKEGFLMALSVPDVGTLTVSKARDSRKGAIISGTGSFKNVADVQLLMATADLSWAGFFLSLYGADGKSLIGDKEALGLAFTPCVDKEHEINGSLCFVANWQSGFTAVGYAEFEREKMESPKAVLMLFPGIQCILDVIAVKQKLSEMVGHFNFVLEESKENGNAELTTKSASGTSGEQREQA